MPARLYLILALALFSVSTTSLVIRYLAAVPAVVMAFWRMFTASGLLWGYSSLQPAGRLSNKNRFHIILAGLFLGGHFACFFAGVRLTTIANATLLGNVAPVFTALLERLHGQAWNRVTIFGLILSLAGAVIIQGGGLTNPENTAGNGLALLSSLFMALAWIQAKTIRKNTHTVVYSRHLFLIAAGTILLVVFLAGYSPFDFERQHLPWFLFLGLVPSVLGHNLLNYAVRFISSTAVASVVLGEPILASFFGFILFQEAMPPASLIGGPMIIIGLYYILSNQSPD